LKSKAVSSGRAARAVHVHLLNAPDIAAYAIPPERLRERLQPLVRARRAALRITEDHDPAQVTAPMREATVLVGFNLPHRRLAEMPRLRWIHLISAGVDHLVPLDWLPPSVTLTNSSGVHAELAGEYACCALLMVNVGMPRHASSQRIGHWDQVFNSPIRGKTVVLIGVGAIGGAAARHAKRLGLRVLGVRRRRRRHPHVDEMYAPEDLPAILPRADFVLVTAALTPQTRGMLGAKELSLLRPGAGVINMSRAGLVDYQALGAKLERGELRGAVIDVCDPEPLPPESALWRVPDLLITPHISSDPLDYVERTMAIIEDNLRRLLAGRPLRNTVDPARGY
jgi:phosphoglycerate dehydrogenase-like enzyme